VVTVVTVPVKEEEVGVVSDDVHEMDVDAEVMALDGSEGMIATSAMNGPAEEYVFVAEAPQPSEAYVLVTETSQPSEATVPSADADATDGSIETLSSSDTDDISNLSTNSSDLHPEPLESPADNAPTAQLAYTKLNYPLHGYAEKLSVLLLKLDGVESFGSKQVRERRKEVAKAIEREATRVEDVWQDAWKRFWRERSQGESSL